MDITPLYITQSYDTCCITKVGTVYLYCIIMCYSQLPQLSHLLQVSADLSLRICIGHGLALLIELARETDEEVSV